MSEPFPILIFLAIAYLFMCFVVLSDEGERDSEGVSNCRGSEPAPSVAVIPGVVGTAGLGLLYTNDFKVSTEAATVCEEVACFAALTCVAELFRSMPTGRMFRSIKVNAARVIFRYACPSVSLASPFFVNFPLRADLDAVPCTRGGILCDYAEIQGRVDSQHTRNESLSAERSAWAERAKGLEARAAKLKGECHDL